MGLRRCKKIISVILALIIFYSLLFNPQKTQAQIENPMAAISVPTWVTSDTPQESKEGLFGMGFGWDTVGYLVAKLALSAMTTSIVNWINSGFEGNPTFVENPGDFLADIADQTTGVFIKKLGMTELCSADWLSKLKISLQYSVPYVKRMQCTLTGIGENFQENYDRFQESFINGGWSSWISMTSNPQNNIYGAYLMSLDELAYRKARAEEMSKMKVSWGQGFKPIETCSEGQSVNDFCNDVCKNSLENYESLEECLGDCKDTTSTEACELSGGMMKAITPGNVIAEQLNLNLGSSVRQMELADEIEESLAAIFNALISQLISTGLRSMSSTSGENEDKQWYNEEPSDNEKNAMISAIDLFLDSEIRYRDAKQASSNAYNETINKLETLKNCYQTWGTACRSKIDATQTQINSYESAKAALDSEVTNSNNLILQAENIKSQINNAGTSSELSALYSEFIDTIQPLLHSYSDADNAESEYDSIKTTLDAENSAIDAEYSQCLSAGCSI
jgi:hypothetical protein